MWFLRVCHHVSTGLYLAVSEQPPNFVLRRVFCVLLAAFKGAARQSVKPKMRKRKLRSVVNWQWALKQKGVKQAGVKEVLSEFGNCVRLI